MSSKNFIKFFKDTTIKDVPRVGGKNASLGEMYRKLAKAGIKVPNGFATTALAYNYFLKQTGLKNKIKKILSGLNTRDVVDLARRGAAVRQLIIATEFPEDLSQAIIEAYKKLSAYYKTKNLHVAVRSSATAEDLPDASFAGQQETFLNVSGQAELLIAVKKCVASLFTNRAISYRVDKGFDHFKIALSVGVQKMIRADLAASGVIFTIDTESGFSGAVLINSIYGLGENIVQGKVDPDEFYIFKPTRTIISHSLSCKKIKMIYNNSNPRRPVKDVPVPLADQCKQSITDKQVLQLADWSVKIEKHYGRAMDIEWALDGQENQLYIIQARPETIHSVRDYSVIEEYVLQKKGKIISTGRSVGNRIGAGAANRIMDIKGIAQFKPGQVLVTDMTDPDWEPIMKIAGAIVTNRGGRTCHAAIISRELGIPCVIGTVDGTKRIKPGADVTVSCAEGESGNIYEGLLKFEVERLDLANVPGTRTKIMMNVGIPEKAFTEGQIPNDGVGLAREEFIINSHIGIHPLALYNFEELKAKAKAGDAEIRDIVDTIEAKTTAYPLDKKQFFIDKLAEGVGRIGAGFYPKDVIVRLSDFKSNEYANLIGGKLYEPVESNPMIGWRGASRYYDPKYKKAFELECIALKKARDVMGLSNIKLMVPFCRTPEEGRKVIEVMREFGLVQGENGLEVYVMCEIPSNVISADAFADVFDGFSIGSNDLTQLTLGLDRDSDLVAHIFDERNEAVKTMVRMVIDTAKRRGRKIGICGQAPSDFPEFATFLVECGIDSISLIPDTVVKTRLAIAKKEKELGIGIK